MNKLLFSFFKTKKEPLIHKGSKLLLIATLFSDPSSLTSTFTDLRLRFFNISYASRTTIITSFLLISRLNICTVISVITQFKPTIRLPVEQPDTSNEVPGVLFHSELTCLHYNINCCSLYGNKKDYILKLSHQVYNLSAPSPF